MPRTKKTMKAADAPGADLPKIPAELIAHFVSGPMSAEAVMEATQAFKKALIERALGAELTHHLGYASGATRPEEAGTHRRRCGPQGASPCRDHAAARHDQAEAALDRALPLS